MKFVSESRHQILGISITFLLLFCTFCSCSHYFDFDSDEELFPSGSATLNGTGSGSGKTAHNPHVIVMGGDSFNRKIECRGAGVTNLTVIQCDRSIIECRNKLSCLVNGTMCTSHDGIVSGEYYCFASRFYHSRHGISGTGTEKCLAVPVSWRMVGGIIKCVSSVSSSSSVQTPTTAMTTTIDYFYSGFDLELHLRSKLEPTFKALIKLEFDFSGEDMMKEDQGAGPIIFYTNEETTFHCTASTFFFNMKSVKIEARTENGTEFKIDPALVSQDSGVSRGLPLVITAFQKFRMAKDISTLSCSGRRLDNSETIRTTWNVTVIDPPLRLFAKSHNGSDFQVVSKIGCNLNPSESTEESKAVRKKLFSLLDISRHSEFWIRSVIQFARFQNITGGNYSCTPLKSKGNSNSNASSVDRFDYYFDPEVKRATIEKPDGSSVVNLKEQRHHSLRCKYTGNPMPYVIWLRNGKEIFYTFQTKISEGEGDFEESVLHLPIKNLDNVTGNSSEISSKSDSGLNSKEEYSCVVRNHVGVDQLDFIIENAQDSPGFSGSASQSKSNDKSGEKSSGLIYGVVISCLLFLAFIALALYAIFTREKYQTKRTIVAKCRVDERGEQCHNVGETSAGDSKQFAGQSHSHKLGETTNSEVSRGVAIASKFQSGDAKYKILT